MRDFAVTYEKDGRNCIEFFAVCSMETLYAEIDNIKANGGDKINIIFY